MTQNSTYTMNNVYRFVALIPGQAYLGFVSLTAYIFHELIYYCNNYL